MNTSTDTCPPLEDLAAFLDGRLSGDERARVVAHLADCPRCYEVFAETARFQLYEEEEDEDEVVVVPPEVAPQGRVIPFPLKKILPRVASIVAAAMAALLAFSVVAIPLYRQYNTIPELTAAKLVSPAVAKVVADEFGDVPRGNPPPGALSSISEFLLGAYTVDLHLSLQQNDSDRAMDDLASINGQMKQLGFLSAQEAAYIKIQTQIDDGTQPKVFVREAALLESQLDASLYSDEISYGKWVPEVLVRGSAWLTEKLVPGQEESYGPSYLAFGKWAETGRLSALAESPDFFQAPENRKFLRVFLRQKREELDPEVKKNLEMIQKSLTDPESSSLLYKNLQQQFESILKHYQEESLNSP